MRQELFFRKKHRVLALLISTMIALTLLLGTAFVLVELNHHCSGEDCPICAAIARDVTFLKANSAAALPHVSLTLCLMTLLLAFSMPQLVRLQKSSPVSLKVKLSD